MKPNSLKSSNYWSDSSFKGIDLRFFLGISCSEVGSPVGTHAVGKSLRADCYLLKVQQVITEHGDLPVSQAPRPSSVPQA